MKKHAGYIILSQDSVTKEIKGRTENSFSMGMESNYVRVDRAFEGRYTAKRKGVSCRIVMYGHMRTVVNNLNRNRTDNLVYKVFRIGSKHCPVKIDWGHFNKLRITNKLGKYDWRNLKFTVKENVKF